MAQSKERSSKELPRELSDDELIRDMRDGHPDAFRIIYRRCQGPVYRFALHMSGSASIAEDITQEVFTALIEEGTRFDSSLGTLSAYLFGIGRHLLSRRLRREQAFVPLPDSESPSSSITRSNSNHRAQAHLSVAPTDLVRAETIERVRQATLSLPANYREVVVLCDLQEMSYDEAASALGCAVGTVRSRLHRARALLMEKLRCFHDPEQNPVAGERARP